MRFTTLLAASAAIGLSNAAPVAQGEGAVANAHHHGMGVEKQLTPFVIDETKYPFHVHSTRTAQGSVPTATNGIIVQGAKVDVPEPDDTHPVLPRSENSVPYKAGRYHVKEPVMGKYNATRPGSITHPKQNITEADIHRPELRKPMEAMRFILSLRRLFPWLDEDLMAAKLNAKMLQGAMGTDEKASATMTNGPKETGKKDATTTGSKETGVKASTTTAHGPKHTGKRWTLAWKKHSTTVTIGGPMDFTEQTSTAMAFVPKETGVKASTTMAHGPKETGKKPSTTMAWKKNHSTTMAQGPQETGEARL